MCSELKEPPSGQAVNVGSTDFLPVVEVKEEELHDMDPPGIDEGCQSLEDAVKVLQLPEEPSGDNNVSGDSESLSEESLPLVSVGLSGCAGAENRLIIPLEVASHSCRALVDTGATNSMVSALWLQERQIRYWSAPAVSQVFGFGINNALPVVGRVM